MVNDSVITDTCGTDDRYCWDELRQWQSDGTISVESDGLTHPDYATLNPDQVTFDASQSLKAIQEKTGVAPLGFADPYDSVPDPAIKLSRQRGISLPWAGLRATTVASIPRIPTGSACPRYPYSNQALYPVINGSNGKTFDQLMSDLIQAQAPAAPTLPAPSAASTPTPDDPGIVGFCQRNPPVDSTDWVNSLDAKAFPAQISQAAQSQLPWGSPSAQPVISSPGTPRARSSCITRMARSREPWPPSNCRITPARIT